MAESSSQKGVVLEIGKVVGTTVTETAAESGTVTVMGFGGCEDNQCTDTNPLNYNSDFQTFNTWEGLQVNKVSFIGQEDWIPNDEEFGFLEYTAEAGVSNIITNNSGVLYSYNPTDGQFNANTNYLKSCIIMFDFEYSGITDFNGATYSFQDSDSNEEFGYLPPGTCVENRIFINDGSDNSRALTEQGRMLYAYPKPSSGFTKGMSFEIMEGESTYDNKQRLLCRSSGTDNIGDFLAAEFPTYQPFSESTIGYEILSNPDFFQNFNYFISPYIHSACWKYQNNSIQYDSSRDFIHVSYVTLDNINYYGSQMNQKDTFGIRSSNKLFYCDESPALGYKLDITIDSMINCSIDVLTFVSDVNSNYPADVSDFQYALNNLNIATPSSGNWVWQTITEPGTYSICVPFQLDTVIYEDNLQSVITGYQPNQSSQNGYLGCWSGNARTKTAGGLLETKIFAGSQYRFLKVNKIGIGTGSQTLSISNFEIRNSGMEITETQVPNYNFNNIDSPIYSYETLDVLNNKSLPVALNFTTGDLVDPGKKTTGYSKTFELPASTRNNRLLNTIIGDNAVRNEDDISWKKARIKSNGVIVFDGFARIEKSSTGSGGRYKCHILQDQSYWPELIGDKKLCELSLSPHTKTYDLVVDSWNNTSSDMADYVYPAINYGKWSPGTGDDCNNAPKTIKDFHPAVFVKSIINKIFSDIGYSIESKFFDSDFFKKLIIPYTSGLEYSNSDTLLGEDGNYTGKSSKAELLYMPDMPACNVFGGCYVTRRYYPQLITTQGTSYMIQGSDSTIINGYTVPFTGNYSIYYSAEVRQSTSDLIENGRWAAWIHVNGAAMKPGGYGSIDAEDSSTYFPTFSNPDYNGGTGNCMTQWYSYNSNGNYQPEDIFIENVQLQQGDKVQISLYGRNQGSLLLASAVTSKIKNQDFLVFPTAGQAYEPDGAIVSLSQALGCGVTQKSFLKGITDLFNLYWTADNESRKVMVEPYNDFYGSGKVVDWTGKLDHTNWEDKYLIDELAKSTNFQYSRDSSDSLVENYNEAMEEEYQEPTDLWSLKIKNDAKYRKSIKELGTKVFSPTASFLFGQGDLTWCLNSGSQAPVMPILWNGDDIDYTVNPYNNVRPDVSHSFKIRILNYGGLSTETGDWEMKDENGNIQTHTSYPYAYTFNQNNFCDLNEPSSNLSFFNLYGNSDVSDPEDCSYQRGLFDRFWSVYFEKVSGGSCLRTCMVNLNSSDIANFDFRDIIKLDLDGGNHSYWTVSRIIDYKPSENSLTKIELVEWKGEVNQNSPSNVIYETNYGGLGGTIGPVGEFINSDGNTTTVDNNGNIFPTAEGQGLPVISTTNNLTLKRLKGPKPNLSKNTNQSFNSSNGFSVNSNGGNNNIKSNGIALGNNLSANKNQIILGQLNISGGADIFQVGGGYVDKLSNKAIRRNAISVDEYGDFTVFGGEIVAEFTTGDLTITGDVYYKDRNGNKKKVYLETKPN
jgi:hypothetical protein